MQEMNQNINNFYMKLLKARIQIARIGEKDKLNWWDVEAQ